MEDLALVEATSAPVELPIVHLSTQSFFSTETRPTSLSRAEWENFFYITSGVFRETPNFSEAYAFTPDDDLPALVASAVYGNKSDSEGFATLNRAAHVRQLVRRHPLFMNLDVTHQQLILDASWILHLFGNYANRFYRRFGRTDLMRWGIPSVVVDLAQAVHVWGAGSNGPSLFGAVRSSWVQILMSAVEVDSIVLSGFSWTDCAESPSDWNAANSGLGLSPSAGNQPIIKRTKRISNLGLDFQSVEWIRESIQTLTELDQDWNWMPVTLPGRISWPVETGSSDDNWLWAVAASFPNEDLGGQSSIGVSALMAESPDVSALSQDGVLVAALGAELALQHGIVARANLSLVSQNYAVARTAYLSRSEEVFIDFGIDTDADFDRVVKALARRARYGIKLLADRFATESEKETFGDYRTDTAAEMDTLTYLSTCVFVWLLSDSAGTVVVEPDLVFPQRLSWTARLAKEMWERWGYLPKILVSRFYGNFFTHSDFFAMGQLWSEKHASCIRSVDPLQATLSDWIGILGYQSLEHNSDPVSAVKLKHSVQIALLWKTCIDLAAQSSIETGSEQLIGLRYKIEDNSKVRTLRVRATFGGSASLIELVHDDPNLFGLKLSQLESQRFEISTDFSETRRARLTFRIPTSSDWPYAVEANAQRESRAIAENVAKCVSLADHNVSTDAGESVFADVDHEYFGAGSYEISDSVFDLISGTYGIGLKVIT
jgi:hypothetical protein